MMDGLNVDTMGRKLMDRYFRKVDNVVWDLMTGRLGTVMGGGGILTLEGEGENAEVVENLFDQFGVALPAFAQTTPVAQIKCGDLIYGDRGVRGWVVKVPAKTKKSFTLLKPSGDRGEWRPPKVKSLGLDLDGAMVVRSLINTLPDGGLGNMQNMLLPMMMMGDGGSDMDEMLPMMLMMQGGLPGTEGAPAASGDMGGMMQTMMMMKMMGGRRGNGGNGGNPRNPSYFDNDGHRH